jgi:hypothetical protein
MTEAIGFTIIDCLKCNKGIIQPDHLPPLSFLCEECNADEFFSEMEKAEVFCYRCKMLWHPIDTEQCPFCELPCTLN